MKLDHLEEWSYHDGNVTFTKQVATMWTTGKWVWNST